MISPLAVGAVLLALALLGILIARRRRRTRYSGERARMPRELREARLVLSEQHLETRGPRPFHGKSDQVFLTRAGSLVPLETKSRPSARIHPSDVIQLSVQARLLRGAPSNLTGDAPVAAYGYVRFSAVDGADRYQRVRLMDDLALDAWHDHYWALREGRVAPRPAARPGLCMGCLHRPQCPHPRVPEGRRGGRGSRPARGAGRGEKVPGSVRPCTMPTTPRTATPHG